MDDNEFKDIGSKCDDGINNKNEYYFIYAMWYRETFGQTLLYLQSLLNHTIILITCGTQPHAFVGCKWDSGGSKHIKNLFYC